MNMSLLPAHVGELPSLMRAIERHFNVTLTCAAVYWMPYTHLSV